jgi:hypothetical protein
MRIIGNRRMSTAIQRLRKNVLPMSENVFSKISPSVNGGNGGFIVLLLLMCDSGYPYYW